MVADLHPAPPAAYGQASSPDLTRSMPAARGRVAGARFAVVALVAAALGIIAAYDNARHSTGQLHFAIFWLAFTVALVSVVAVGLHIAASVRTRLGLLLGWGLLTFLPKFLMSANGPVYFDEYGHWRHANDIVSTGHVNVASHYLPIIRYYPGLEILTAWMHDVTRLSTWRAGQLIVLVAHCAVLFVIFVMTRALGLSERAAFLSAIVYSTNSSYMYFDTQYGYESLGLPLAFATVAMVVLARRATSVRASALWAVGALPCGLACIVTHHISAAAMVAIVVLVAAAVPPRRELAHSDVAQWGPIGVGLALAIGFVLWVTVVAPATYDYISPHVRLGLSQLGDALSGRHRIETFQNGQVALSTRHVPFAGSGAPSYEVVAAFLAPVIVAIAALGATIQAWRQRHDVGRLALLAPFFLLTVLYFVSLPLALTAAGGEAGHRTWGLAYLGVAVLAVSSGSTWRSWTRRVPRRAAAVAALLALVVVAIGNVAAGMNVDYRFPGPSAFGSDTRSQSAELNGLVDWARHSLPRGAKVVTDRFTSEAVTGYTTFVTPAPSDYGVFYLYSQGGAPSDAVRQFVSEHGFRYWILDTRIETMKPEQPFFLGYGTRVLVSSPALRALGSSDYLKLLHRTAHYEVFEIVG